MEETLTSRKEVTLDVPACWGALLEIEEFDETVQDGDKREKALDDPTPYYDDTRVITKSFDDGAVVTLFFSSGQTNYWASYDLWRGDNLICESEPFHNLAEGEVWEHGVYRVTVRLIEPEGASA